MSPRLAVLPAEARPQLPRIVALSATFTIHVVGFALLAMPISRPIESFEREVDSPMVWIEAPPKPEPLPAVPIPPTIKKTKPVTRPRPEPISTAPVFERVALPEPALDLPVIDPPIDASEAFESTIDTGPVDAGRLGIVFGPAPGYPISAIRKQLEGEVLLKILVDERGRATSVEVVDSSGHRVLDEAARKAVMKWRFKPAMRGGVAVPAYGTVPVVFSLARG